MELKIKQEAVFGSTGNVVNKVVTSIVNKATGKKDLSQFDFKKSGSVRDLQKCSKLDNNEYGINNDSEGLGAMFNTHLVDENGKSFSYSKVEIKKDPNQMAVQLKFDVDNLPPAFADAIVPNGKGALKDDVWDYSNGTATMVFYMDDANGENTNNNTDNTDNTDNEETEETEETEEESVMVPTPAPYKGYQVDKNGHTTKHKHGIDNNSRKITNMNEINEEVNLNNIEVLDDNNLIVSVNGKEYRYVNKPQSQKSIQRIAESVKGMMKYSNNKALQYLKRNLQLAEDIVLGEPDIQNGILYITINGKQYRYKSNSDKTVFDIADSIEGIKKYSHGKALAYLKKNTELVEGNGFKDHHICKKCGEPLSKCTCKVECEEDAFGGIDGGYSGGGTSVSSCGATQSSSIGQYKTSPVTTTISVNPLTKEQQEKSKKAIKGKKPEKYDPNKRY